MEQIEWESAAAIADNEVPPPPNGVDTRLSAVLARRWQAIAGLGIASSVLLLMISSVWATWSNSGKSLTTDGLAAFATSTRPSNALIVLGATAPSVSSLIGIAALAAYVFGTRRPHPANRPIAIGFFLVGAVYWSASIWTFARSFDAHVALAAGPSRMVYAGGFVASVVIVALALAVLSVRPGRHSA